MKDSTGQYMETSYLGGMLHECRHDDELKKLETPRERLLGKALKASDSDFEAFEDEEAFEDDPMSDEE